MITAQELTIVRQTSALDRATSTFLTQMARSGLPPLHEMALEQARSLVRQLRKSYGPGPGMLRSEQATVTVRDGSFPVRILVPMERPRGIIVYYHGGGWV